MNRTTAILVALATLLAHVLAINQNTDGLFAPPHELAHVAYRIARNLVHEATPAWNSRDGGPDPSTVTAIPGRGRIAAVPVARSATRALAWSFSRKSSVGSYPLGLGRPSLVAAGPRHLAVLDANAAGRAYPLDGGGGAVDLALVDGAAEPCCAAMGGGVLAIATARGVIHLHDATTGDLVQVLDPGFVAELTAVAVSPNGDVVAVGSAGGELATFRR